MGALNPVRAWRPAPMPSLSARSVRDLCLGCEFASKREVEELANGAQSTGVDCSAFKRRVAVRPTCTHYVAIKKLLADVGIESIPTPVVVPKRKRQMVTAKNKKVLERAQACGKIKVKPAGAQGKENLVTNKKKVAKKKAIKRGRR